MCACGESRSASLPEGAWGKWVPLARPLHTQAPCPALACFLHHANPVPGRFREHLVFRVGMPFACSTLRAIAAWLSPDDSRHAPCIAMRLASHV